MEPAKESFRERQLAELEAIESIFGSDVENLRQHAPKWKPTDIRIHLTPLRDSSNGQTEAHVRTKLHITCPSKYPKIAPKIVLEESKGLSDQLLKELENQLKSQAEELCGEVMIYQLAQTVQAFLLANNKPPSGSFYDEMLQEQQKREQERHDEQLQIETHMRQTRQDEVERCREILNNERKRRGHNSRRSISESNNRNPTSSESSENSSPYYCGSHGHPNRCLEHRNCDDLYFRKYSRQIKRGSCLGHSQKGFVTYTGIDTDTGQLLFITEWSIKYTQLEKICGNGGKCYWFDTDHKCTGNHNVDEFINSIEKQVDDLRKLRHKNLIQYECVLCMKRKDTVSVYIVQDFMHGTSVFSISSSGLGWCIDGARMVARGVLDALVYLHNRGVSHSHLLDNTVFMDNAGTIRCTDFSVVPLLLELIGGPGARSTLGDLPALGALVESLLPTLTFEMRDFVDKCNSDRTLSASELLEHPFLRSSLFTHENNGNGYLHMALSKHTNEQRKSSLAVATLDKTFKIPALSQSRLRTEFEVLMYLGKGAFGDVLKVRNILDNREYAIKRIPLPARSRQLYKKMTREVELLSRLNHENVVRYFNSWIESVNDEDADEIDKLLSGEWSVSHESIKPKSPPSEIGEEATEDSSSSTWPGYMPNMDDSDSDGIQFVDSNGEVAVYDEDEEEEASELAIRNAASPKPLMQIMYIQMEFCEKCTLRTAIDDKLYENTDRLWRLFREVAEGLSHIHQQGIIHRDLKPVNIFLDSHDQIKIGDFGLATTSCLALQTQPEQVSQQTHIPSTEDGTGTGKVGTTLYVAPELTGNASRSTYNQKVDMYTLGIILFEMCQPPFGTGMERAQTIIALRSSAIVIPDNMLQDSKYDKTVDIIRWLLNHDPALRPTAEELLASDLLPPASFEANELQEMLRHALANPQSKAYKHLVARCLQQESDEVLEHTYYLGSNSCRSPMKSWNSPIASADGAVAATTTTGGGGGALVSLNSVVEFVKTKVVSAFRKHGAIEVDTPLLAPLSRNTNHWPSAVKLMTHSGCVVVLPSDLRQQFASHISMSGANSIRRYCVDRVYREEKVFNFHPKENYECAFDIITPNTGSMLVDAELLAIAFEITNELPRLRERNITIRINHTNLLRAILLYCNVPKSSYGDLFGNIFDFIEGRLSKFQFHSSVSVILEKSRSSASILVDLLLANFLLSGTRSSVDDSSLRSLLRGKDEASSLAKGAMRDLESMVNLAQSMGVTWPIYVYAGLPLSFDRASNGGIVWQMLTEIKPNRSSRPSVIATGERYDSMLHDFQKKAQSFNANNATPHRGISGAGLSLCLDKLVAAIGTEHADEYRAIDVGVCVCGSRPPLTDVTHILRLLWSVGIRASMVECAGTGSADDSQDLAKLGASHIILIAENGSMRLRSFADGRFQERHVGRSDLIEFVHRLARTEGSSAVSSTCDVVSQLSSSAGGSGGNFGGRGDNALSTSTSYGNLKSYNPSGLSQLQNVEIVFMFDRPSNYRKRHESQVIYQMSVTLAQFVKKESILVLVVDLPTQALNAFVGTINPRAYSKKETDLEILHLIERFPKHKHSIIEIHEEVCDRLTDAKAPIVALYSLTDSYYRVIL